MSKPRLLLVDDDFAHRTMLKAMLKSWNYEVFEVDDGDVAIKAALSQDFDIVLSDIRMARLSGLDALHQIKEAKPNLPIILMTAYSSVETAIDALRHGAYDYVAKPLDFDYLKTIIENAISHQNAKITNDASSTKNDKNAKTEILGKSQKIKELIQLIQTVAPSEANILISGESGTGKELVASSIKKLSKRYDKAFITLNCAAISENLLESELFGHEKGAFTGADKARDGRFKQADGGTLFLDEIGELPLSLQAKLLRAIQQGEIQKLGSDKPFFVDVRIIAATNVDLLTAVNEGKFREDLYFRLNVINLEVPALIERKDDILLLAEHFIEKFNEINKKNIRGISDDALKIMMEYSWRGNVRELENTIERAVILCQDSYISIKDLPNYLAIKAKSSHFEQLSNNSLDNLEQQAIISALADNDNNKTKAAQQLGITRATLHNKLKKYNINT